MIASYRIPSVQLTVICSLDYLDPFLNKEIWGNSSDVLGFRSVLKLTPSHPRNPRYKWDTHFTSLFLFINYHQSSKMSWFLVGFSICCCCRDICNQIKAMSANHPFCVPYHPKIFNSISVSVISKKSLSYINVQLKC